MNVLSLHRLITVKVIDPKTNLRKYKMYLFKVPGNQVTYQEFTANSTSKNSISWKLQTPGPSTIISCLMLHQKDFGITILSSAKFTDGSANVPIPIDDLLPGVLPQKLEGSDADIKGIMQVNVIEIHVYTHVNFLSVQSPILVTTN